MRFSLVIVIAALSACSGHSRAVIDGGVVDGSGVDAAGMVDGSGVDAGAVLCNGDPGVRLVYRTAGGGQVLPGSQVISENGFQYLLVDGTCHFWAMSDANVEVRASDLTSAQAAKLAQDFRLSDWSTLNAQYVRNLCDGGNDVFRFGDTRTTIFSVCGGGDTASAVQWLTDAASSNLASLYEAAIPVGGDARFVLVQEGSQWSDIVAAGAAPWPLSSDPATLALTYEQATSYVHGSSRAAAPPDADALKALRRNFLGDGGGAFSGGFIPVLGGQGDRYELFVRDSIPLEDAQGLLHVD